MTTKTKMAFFRKHFSIYIMNGPVALKCDIFLEWNTDGNKYYIIKYINFLIQFCYCVLCLRALLFVVIVVIVFFLHCHLCFCCCHCHYWSLFYQIVTIVCWRRSTIPPPALPVPALVHCCFPIRFGSYIGRIFFK